MKKYSLILLFFCTTGFLLKAQTKQDSAFQYDNRYGPFHQELKDTTKRTVSEFGHYFSAGVGAGKEYGIGGAISLISYSFAFKSFLFSFTRGGGQTLFSGGGDNAVYYRANYFGVLIGESVRFKNAMISLSAGVASSNIEIRYQDVTSKTPNHYIDSVSRGIASFPIELKVFLLARNGIGYGIHLSKNIVSPYKFSPFYFGVCIVFGKWNNSRKK